MGELLLPPLTSANVVWRERDALHGVPHVLGAISAFLDPSEVFESVASAASIRSPWLLHRVALLEAHRWCAAQHSETRVRCLKQQQFAAAMGVAVRDGALSVAKWLRDVYFSEGRIRSTMFEDAAHRGHAEVLAWLATVYPKRNRLRPRSLCVAISAGHLGVVQWWWRHYDESTFLMVPVMYQAAEAGQLDIIVFLHTHTKCPASGSISAIDSAASNGHLDVVKWLHENRGDECSIEAFKSAVKRGHLGVAKYLARAMSARTYDIVGYAACSGSVEMLNWAKAQAVEFGIMHYEISHDVVALKLSVLQWLLANKYAFNATGIFREAVKSGDFQVVQWVWDKFKLQTFGENGRTRTDVDKAAATGNLAMVQWLSRAGFYFTAQAMDFAAANGDLEMVQWLHANRDEGCSTAAMNAAAANGHLTTVQFLHFHRTEGCTTKAMDMAAANGYLDVVKFLHNHRNEGCTTNAMDQAANRGDLEMVQFLHANRHEGCTVRAMDASLDMEILDYLHKNRIEGCTETACEFASELGRLDILEWLFTSKRRAFSVGRILQHARRFEQFHVEMWIDVVLDDEIQ
ncbi:Ankyrin repeat-containing protein, partial [Globisporangium splendens]